MTSNRRPENPFPWVGVGAFISLTGGLLLALDDTVLVILGVALLVVGSCIVLVSSVAAGVVWGIQRAQPPR